jgi:heme oxygenase (mycobilin-producing)
MHYHGNSISAFSRRKQMVRVLMTRRVPKLASGLESALLSNLNELLFELRNMANHQPGYISGETMRNVEDRNEYLVISTWKSLEAWKRWMANENRAEKEGHVDVLLGSPTVYKVYSYD